MRNKFIILSGLIFLTACSSVPVPNVNLIPERINEINSIEYSKIKQLSKKLNSYNSLPIYLYIHDDSRITNQTGHQGLPPSLRIMAMSAAQDLAPKVEVFTDVNNFIHQAAEVEGKKDRAFLIEGALTEYNKNSKSISSGFDFGLDFGKGKGDSDYDSQFRNTDEISSLTLDLFFKQDGKIYTKSTGTIKIQTLNRGYNFGVSVNGSGIGMNAYQTKSEGIGKSTRRLLHHALYSMINEVVERKHLIIDNNIGTPSIHTFRPQKNYYTPTTNNIDEAVDQLLNSIE